MCKATVSSHSFFQSQGDFLPLRPSTQQREREREREIDSKREREREEEEERSGRRGTRGEGWTERWRERERARQEKREKADDGDVG